INARTPVERLIDERDRRCPPSTKDDRADRHAIRLLPVRIDCWTLRSRSRKARVWVCGLRSSLPCDLRRPTFALPVKTFGGRIVRHPLPPHATFRRQCDVSENGVARKSRHRVRVRLGGSTRRNSEEACFGVYCTQAPSGVRLEPCNVVADGPDLPTLKTCRRNHHRKVGLATRRRKGRGNVGLLSLRIFDSYDEHVLSHPTLIACDVRGDSQSETFFAEKRVTAVA